MFRIAVGPEGPTQGLTLTERFVVPLDATPVFLEDIMAAMSAVTRKHGAAMLGGVTEYTDGTFPPIHADWEQS